jgi:transcriptional regulator with GAF, ATPase, and Fis domain/Tfp pilus assembly protein PilZ
LRYDKERRHVRIPLYTSVEASGPHPLGRVYSWNISEGGLYLKAPDAQATDAPLGAQLSLSFSLPDAGPPLALTAEVVWVDPVVRDHRGRRAVGLGVRFEEASPAVKAQILHFIEAFRYRIVVLGFSDLELVRRALGDYYTIEETASEDHLEEVSGTGDVGLVLLGEGGATAGGLERLRRVCSATSMERQPPILYCGQAPSDALEDLVTKSGRVIYQEMPALVIELRTLVQRSVEAHMLAFENERLTAELERALERLRRENQYLRGRVAEPSRLGGLVGDSAAMRRVYELCEQVAALQASVIITGETGTGKDRIARAIHALGSRADRPFIAQNCAAVAESLLDSELFGHARGAFTGAVGERPGLFESANGGTVFLDEIGEMPASMQAKLLRVLENGEVRRVGSTQLRRVDVRILCATHRDLEELVAQKQFRQDLYYRLCSFVVRLPPLRERSADIPALAMHFLDQFADRHQRATLGLTAEAMRVLEEHPWPGNVRELEHAMERLVVLCAPGGKIDAALVRETLGRSAFVAAQGGDPADGHGHGVGEGAASLGLDEALRRHERQLILAALERADGVLASAARALGVDRTTLSKRCKRLGLRQGGS